MGVEHSRYALFVLPPTKTSYGVSAITKEFLVDRYGTDESLDVPDAEIEDNPDVSS